MITSPGYQQGFARVPGEREYQGEARKGLVAYHPCLGAAGGVLYDQSGYARTGVAQAGPVWLATPHSYGLDYTAATSQYVLIPHPLVTAFPFTLWSHFRVPAGAGVYALFGLGDSANAVTNLAIQVNAGNGQIWARDAGVHAIDTFAGAIALTVGEYHTVAGLFHSATLRELVVDGRSDGTSVAQVDFAAGIDQAGIGALVDLTPSHYMNDIITATAAWDRILTLTELKELATEPHLLLEETVSWQ